MAALTVSNEWLHFAHGPGAEDGYQLAVRIIDATTDWTGSTKFTDPELVAEIIDVAELYTDGTSVQEDDRLWWRAYPSNLIRRAKAWQASRRTR